MSRSLQDILRAGAEHSRANAPRGARDCFAEREDLRRQVEGMDALRETSNVYKQMYEELLERHKGVMDRLEYSLDVEKKKMRMCMSNANEARAKGDREQEEYFEKCRIQARSAIQELNYVKHGHDQLPPEDGEPQAGERLNQERLAGWRRNELLGRLIRLKRAQAEREAEDEELARAIAASDLQDV